MRVVSKMGILSAVVGAALVLSTQSSVASDASNKAIAKALQDNLRTEQEKARDTERKPLETLDFFGLEPDMTVVELMPGGGWYTKVLAKTLEDKGKLYVALGTGRVAENLEPWKLQKVDVLASEANLEPTEIKGIFKVNEFALDAPPVDMVLTFRNAHNLHPEARAKLNDAVFAALKPGGVYGIVDHTRRHNEPYSRPVWRRLDPVLVIQEVLNAGFEFVGFSDLHYQPADKLTTDTRDEQLSGPSDRFTLKFRKPL